MEEWAFFEPLSRGMPADYPPRSGTRQNRVSSASSSESEALARSSIDPLAIVVSEPRIKFVEKRFDLWTSDLIMGESTSAFAVYSAPVNEVRRRSRP